MALKPLFLVALVLALGACAVGDKEGEGQTQTQTGSLVCDVSPKLMLPTETFSAAFSRVNTSGSIDFDVDGGATLNFLDWGSLTSTADASAEYTAPSFVPETRQVAVTGRTGDGAEGRCPLYLLQSGHFGVADDGKTDGIVSTFYNFPGATANAIPSLNGLTVNNVSVLRDLTFNNVGAATLVGVTGMSANYVAHYRGRIVIPTAGVRRFAFVASRRGLLKINNQEVTSTGANVNLDTNITAAGSYPFEIYHVQTTGNITLRLSWATQTGPTTFTTPVAIPYSAFDRP